MPEIKGFQGWRYDSRKIGGLRSVVAPPYDVISKKEQGSFYKKSPYNVIRLILGKKQNGDSAARNQYTRARKYFDDWKLRGVVSQDPVDSIYVYVQDYKEEGLHRRRVGFVAAMKLDEGLVLRHEKTLAAPKKDRMALLKEVQTNLSPIFGLFEDRRGVLQKALKKSMRSVPCADLSVDGVRHRLFLQADRESLEEICRAFHSKPVFIADGHHRFEVASQFKKWMNKKYPSKKGAEWHYVMAYFSDYSHNPFKIFPTHRLIRLPKKIKTSLELLMRKGQLKKVSSLSKILSALSKSRQESTDKGYSFGIFTKKEGYFILRLDRKFFSKLTKKPVGRLDVSVLHRTLIEPCFGIRSIEKSDAIDFTHSAKAACEEVRRGNFELALFLRPTSLKEMIEVSKKGLKMPQKSTYFYPKLLSGLVFHQLD